MSDSLVNLPQFTFRRGDTLCIPKQMLVEMGQENAEAMVKQIENAIITGAGSVQTYWDERYQELRIEQASIEKTPAVSDEGQ